MWPLPTRATRLAGALLSRVRKTIVAGSLVAQLLKGPQRKNWKFGWVSRWHQASRDESQQGKLTVWRTEAWAGILEDSCTEGEGKGRRGRKGEEKPVNRTALTRERGRGNQEREPSKLGEDIPNQSQRLF